MKKIFLTVFIIIISFSLSLAQKFYFDKESIIRNYKPVELRFDKNEIGQDLIIISNSKSETTYTLENGKCISFLILYKDNISANEFNAFLNKTAKHVTGNKYEFETQSKLITIFYLQTNMVYFKIDPSISNDEGPTMIG